MNTLPCDIVLQILPYLNKYEFRFLVEITLLILIIFLLLILFINILYIFNYIDDLKETQYNITNYLYEWKQITRLLNIKKIESNKNHHNCCICFKEFNTIVIVFQPCNHACMCERCYKIYIRNNYNKCPMCLLKFSNTMKIYLS